MRNKLLFIFLLLNAAQLVAQSDRVEKTNSDSLTITTKLSDTSVFQVDSFSNQQNMIVWVRFINNSGKSLRIDRITANDNGTIVKCAGKGCNNRKLNNNDTLTFYVLLTAGGKKGPLKRDIHIIYSNPKDKTDKSFLIQFSILTFVKD